MVEVGVINLHNTTLSIALPSFFPPCGIHAARSCSITSILFINKLSSTLKSILNMR